VALKWGYEDLRTVIALPDATARKTLRKTLQSEGMLHCREVAEMPALREKVVQGDPDLLITTLNDQGWDTAGLIRDIRHGAVGSNPFMVIIVLLDQAAPAMVNRVVNAGADDLLLPPWLGRLVIDRLDNFVQGRKPFLVTFDYIGPERRTLVRDDKPPPAIVEIPNPVKWLSDGNEDRAAFRKKIQHACEAINLRKIKSTGGQLRVLSDLAVELFAKEGHSAILQTVHSLLDASNEMARRAANTDFAPAIELTSSLRTLCERLLREDRPPKPDEIAVLPTLAAAVVNAIYWHEKDPLPTARVP